MTATCEHVSRLDALDGLACDCTDCTQLATPWWRPVDGFGMWEPTPKPSKVAQTVDFVVATIALLIAMTVFLGLVALGRAAMCSAYDNGLRYCPGFVSEQPR